MSQMKSSKMLLLVFQSLAFNLMIYNDFAIASTTSHWPSFGEPISNVTEIVGGNVTFSCVIENLGHFRVFWMHTTSFKLLSVKSRVMVRDRRFKIVHNNFRTWNLHIHNVQDRDRGEYRCEVNTDPIIFQTAYLEVLVPPYLNEELTSLDTYVDVGTNVSLRCEAKGFPLPEVTWSREDGSDIILNAINVSSVKGNYLNITEIDRLQTGAYICTASNGISPALTKRILLDTGIPPHFNKKFTSRSDVIVREGTNVSLRCDAKGRPLPDVTWRREDGKEIVLDTVNVTSVSGNYLNITNVSRLHMGAYFCSASNGFQPSKTKRILLTVRFKPTIWIPKRLVRAPIASDVLLQCKFETYPTFFGYWMKDGITIRANNRYRMKFDPPRMYKGQLDLYITNLQPEDFGLYTCVIQNTLGEAKGKVIVYGKSSFLNNVRDIASIMNARTMPTNTTAIENLTVSNEENISINELEPKTGYQ